MKSKEQLIQESILLNKDIKNLEKLKQDIINTFPTSTLTCQAGTFSFVTEDVIKELNNQILKIKQDIKSYYERRRLD